MKVYLDNAATTPMYPEVVDHMAAIMKEDFGNPSSIHGFGRTARAKVEEARKMIADQIGASIGEIIFTSGGTESNNMALKCSVRDLGVTRIISSPIEHHCVLHCCERLASQGVELVMLPVFQNGDIDLDALRKELASSRKKTIVSLMHANNEIGTLLDIESVSEMCTAAGALFHSDTVQTIGYYPPNVSQNKFSFISGSAHKFYGPKGIGFLYMNHDNILEAFIDGGSQERNMRAGTENIAGIVGMHKALSLVAEKREEIRSNLKKVKSYFLQGLQEIDPNISVNGRADEGALANVLNVHFPPHAKSSMLLMYLDIKGIAASGGSACSSGSAKKSHVISTLYPEREGGTDIRFSFSSYTTQKDIDFTLDCLKEILV